MLPIPERMQSDVETIVATVLGTFNLSDYTPDEMQDVWDDVRAHISDYIIERKRIERDPSL